MVDGLIIKIAYDYNSWFVAYDNGDYTAIVCVYRAEPIFESGQLQIWDHNPDRGDIKLIYLGLDAHRNTTHTNKIVGFSGNISNYWLHEISVTQEDIGGYTHEVSKYQLHTKWA